MGNDEIITLREAARKFNRREEEVSVCKINVNQDVAIRNADVSNKT